MAKVEDKLSRRERYFLSNQLRILEALYPEEATQIANRREAIERGYELLYRSDMDYILDGNDAMTVNESKEVWDTMDMFDAIQSSIKATGELFLDNPNTKFSGYDGNNETKFMSFAAFTVERLERFTYVPMTKPGYWNSHAPMRPIYQRMLDVWNKLPNKHKMSKDQLRKVVSAAAYPGDLSSKKPK